NLMSNLRRLRRASYSSGVTGPRAMRSLGSALPRLPRRFGSLISGMTSTSLSLSRPSSYSGSGLLLAGRPGPRAVGLAMRSASFSSALVRSAAVAVRAAPFAVARLAGLADLVAAFVAALVAVLVADLAAVLRTDVLRGGLLAASNSSAALRREA